MITDLDVARKYVQLEQSATSRGIPFNLSLLSVRNLLQAKRCYYTGVTLVVERLHPNKRTVDRKDNTAGYIIGNVVACSLEFNQKKGGLTPEDIRVLAKRVL